METQGWSGKKGPKYLPTEGEAVVHAQVLPLEPEEPAGPSHSLWEVEFGLPDSAWERKPPQ